MIEFEYKIRLFLLRADNRPTGVVQPRTTVVWCAFLGYPSSREAASLDRIGAGIGLGFQTKNLVIETTRPIMAIAAAREILTGDQVYSEGGKESVWARMIERLIASKLARINDGRATVFKPLRKDARIMASDDDNSQVVEFLVEMGYWLADPAEAKLGDEVFRIHDVADFELENGIIARASCNGRIFRALPDGTWVMVG